MMNCHMINGTVILYSRVLCTNDRYVYNSIRSHDALHYTVSSVKDATATAASLTGGLINLGTCIM